MNSLRSLVLPPRLRRLVPDRLRDDQRLRAFALGTGLIPPRKMHSAAEAELLCGLASQAGRVVEIGVYEGSSAVEFVRVMKRDAELHLIDPYGHHAHALPAGWGATEWATKRSVRRAAGAAGPRVTWHIVKSVDAGANWTRPIDFVFIDGDHSESGALADWHAFSQHVEAGGHVAFHDARYGRPGGLGAPGPTAVVDRLFRGDEPLEDWTISAEVDRTVVVQRAPASGRPEDSTRGA